jgi:hypothetical protein
MRYRAFFIGWQEWPDSPPDLLFNINDPSNGYHGSTVGVDRLRAEGMMVQEIKWTLKENT